MTVLTEREVRTVRAVFESLLVKEWNTLNTFLGSITIAEMQDLALKLRYADYCEENKILFEEMTEDDFIEAHYRKMQGSISR